MSVETISKATDKDAEYVLRRLAIIDECEAGVKSNTKRGNEARLEAGKRLIEVRKKLFSNKGILKISPVQTRVPDFAAWLRENGIPKQTASDLMRDAGFTEEQRTKHRTAGRERSRKGRKVSQFTKLIREINNSTDDEDETIDTSHLTLQDWQSAYWSRVNMACEYAKFPYPKNMKADKLMVDSARACAVLWEEQARQLEKLL